MTAGYSPSMIFSIDTDTENLEFVSEQHLSQLGVLERQDLQEWAIEQPRILGEELLVITSEYAGFEDVRDRLDILALDSSGRVVVIELKRDRADRTADLQAIKYASYCATLTSEDIQKEYREFWSTRDGSSFTPEEVGQEFAEFLSEVIDTDEPYTDEGWANFALDDKPRILLVAGEFGTEVTAPVMWLIEEYGLDISCVKIDAYQHQGRLLLNSQQVIPIPEAEDYMTRRREKQERQETKSRRRAINVLLDRGVLIPGDELVFTEDRRPPESEWVIDPEPEFWKVTVTGDTGQSDNIKWLYDGETYSFSGLTRELLHHLIGRDADKPINGYKFWCHPQFDGKHLSELRNENAKAPERKTG